MVKNLRFAGKYQGTGFTALGGVGIKQNLKTGEEWLFRRNPKTGGDINNVKPRIDVVEIRGEYPERFKEEFIPKCLVHESLHNELYKLFKDEMSPMEAARLSFTLDKLGHTNESMTLYGIPNNPITKALELNE